MTATKLIATQASIHCVCGVKERPILFSASMVRALLDGTKTQTRRIVKPQPPVWANKYWGSVGTYSGLSEPIHYWEGEHPEYKEEGELLWPSNDKWSDQPQWDRFEGTGLISPYGSEKNSIKKAARIWVRESWQAWAECDKQKADELSVDARLHLNYPADGNTWPNRIRPSIHMPHWASRITLEITGVRVERLKHIRRGDAMAEGCPFSNIAQGQDPRNWYAELWNSINGPNSWAANPWVWVIEFKKAHQ